MTGGPTVLGEGSVNSIGAASYAAAAAAFLALTMLLVVSWRGRAQGARLIAAAALTTLWAAVLAWRERYPSIPFLAIYTLEILRDGAWFVALIGLAQGLLPGLLSLMGNLLWLGLLVAGWAIAVLPVSMIAVEVPQLLLIVGGLANALLLLMLIGQIYRNANAVDRHGFIYLAVGLGGVFAYDLFLYSQAELLGAITAGAWLARGAVDALFVPFIAVAARRNSEWAFDVFVSRQVVTFTTAIIGVGIYLVAAFTGSYFVQQVGGRWSPMANAIFLVGALVVLAAVLRSGGPWRRLRVFVSKHFYRNKYDYRIEWLRFVQTLSAGHKEDVLRASLKAIAQIFESPGAVMYGRGDLGSHFVPVAAWPMRIDDLSDLQSVPAGHEMLRFVERRHWVIDLKEHAQSPAIYQNVAVPETLAKHGRIRVVLPLPRPEGLAGFVLLFDRPPPFELTYEDRDLLKTVGRHVATIVAQQEADRRLAENRQFEAYHRLTSFLMHDLKNSVAQLQLVVRNAERHRHKPEFVDDAMLTIANAVERMTRLLDQLRDSGRQPVAKRVELVGLVREVVSRCSDRRPAAEIGNSPAAAVFVRADPDRLSASLEHVVRNAQDACRSGDKVVLEIVADARRVRLTVRDTGCGMAPDFVRERLFRPFDSTKGSRGMGIGAFQVREYVRSLGGDIEVQSSPGTGTRFDIMLPAGNDSHA